MSAIFGIALGRGRGGLPRGRRRASRSSTSPGTTAGPRTTSSGTPPACAIGPEPLTTTIGSSPYLDVQTAHDLAFAWGSRSFIKSHNANDVRPEALDELVELVGAAPGDSSFSITALGGAIGRVAEDATAYAGRAAAFDLSADSSWTERVSTTTRTSSGAAGRSQIVEPDRALGAYANGNSDVGPEETRRIYGDAKVARLAALKRTWDPDNVFHVNPNVTPAESD